MIFSKVSHTGHIFTTATPRRRGCNGAKQNQKQCL